MKNHISTSIIVSQPITNIWNYVSDFTNASHQTIGVMKTEGNDHHRKVTFKNGHEVSEVLIEKIDEKSIKWLQKTTKGFIPIREVESEIILEGVSQGTRITFNFYYNTIMGPIGWMMNIIMIQSKLRGYAKMNLRKIQKAFS